MSDLVRLQSEAIDEASLVDAVRSPEAGAVATFSGTVRNHNRGRRVQHLEYEAYAGMAESEMANVVARAREKYPVQSVALVHRTGRLEIGDVSVAVAVSSAHRADAIEACRLIIDELKRTVPIWKREVFEGGEVSIREIVRGGELRQGLIDSLEWIRRVKPPVHDGVGHVQMNQVGG